MRNYASFCGNWPVVPDGFEYHLLTLDAEMGFDIWVARNDRGRKWNGTALGELHNWWHRVNNDVRSLT